MLETNVGMWDDIFDFFKKNLSFVVLQFTRSDKVRILHNSTNFSFLKKGRQFDLSKLVEPSSLDELRTHYENASSEAKKMRFELINEFGRIEKIVSQTKVIEGNIESIWVKDIPPGPASMDLIVMLAHDIRSPVNSILGLLNVIEIMQSSGELTLKELNKITQMIKACCHDAIDFTDDVLAMARIESSYFSLKKESVSLSGFIANYIDTHRLVALKKQISINYKSEVGIDDTTKIDKIKVTQVFDNLLSNAVKFSYDGSKIDIDLRMEKENLAVRITDHGVGMSDDMVQSIFVKFGKSRRKGLSGEKSHGLGMSIVKQIMELHKGEIKVKSSKNNGTEMMLIFKK